METYPNIIEGQVDNENVVLELKKAVQRETGFGLWRVDFDFFHEELNQLTQKIEDRVIKTRVSNAWGIIHRPGGNEVLSHTHNKWWTGIYYPKAHTAPLLIGEERAEIYPEPGLFVVLEPGELHGVAANESTLDRYSVVFTWLG